jgi:hypothetical protein
LERDAAQHQPEVGAAAEMEKLNENAKRSGTDVMILKYFRRKLWRKMDVFGSNYS